MHRRMQHVTHPESTLSDSDSTVRMSGCLDFTTAWKLTHLSDTRVLLRHMRFCDECGSLMHTEGDTWVCRACEHEEMRDSQAEAPMATQERQQDDGAPDVADVTQGTTETMQEPCPAADCDSDRAYYEMMPKPGGSYDVRLFTCMECGHKWRET